MISRTHPLHLTLALAVLAAAGPGRAEPVTEQQRANVRAAVPSTAPAKPAKPHRILAFTQTKGYRHASIEVGVEALTLMGERTGAYTLTATEDPAVFTAAQLKGYDGVLFLNVTGDIFDRVERQQVLLDFVRAGGAVMGIHSATDACYDWPDWGDMLGGWFDGHPWTADQRVTLWIEEPGHPLNASFNGATSYAIQDEIYQLKGPDFRANHRVLISLDPRRTDMTLAGIKREDRDFPITQIREYGKGRVFYCSLGHNQHIYWNPVILQHYLAGFQWALGDLPAVAAPRPRGAMPALVDDPALFDAVARTSYADDQRAFGWLQTAVAEAGRDRAKLGALERKLTGLLQAGSTTPAARQAICQALGMILSADQSPKMNAALLILGRMLSSEQEVNLARLALDPVAGEAVDDLYLKALRGSAGSVRLALVQSAGFRKMRSAVPVIAPWLNDSDRALADTVAAVLGQIGDKAARKALAAAKTQGPAVIQGRLAIAATLSGRGAADEFEPIYRNASVAEAQRATALAGLLVALPSEAPAMIAGLLAAPGAPSRFRQVAIAAIGRLSAKDASARLAAALPKWDAATQAAVLPALANRGDAAAVPAVRALLAGADETVRLAAIDALGRLPADAATAGQLLGLSVAADDAGKAAATALARLNGAGVNEFLLAGVRGSESALRAACVRQIGRRSLTESIPVLLALRQDADAAVRLAALESLGEIGGMKEQAALLEWTLRAADKAEQTRAGRALLTLTLREEDTRSRAAAIVAALRTGDTAGRLALLPLMSRLGGDPGLDSLAELALRGEGGVPLMAVDQLAKWPESKAAAGLISIARDTADEGVRTAAVAGAMGHFSRDRRAIKDAPVEQLGRLLDLPAKPEARREQIFLLSRYADEKVIALVERFRADAALSVDVDDAIAAVRSNLAGAPLATASAATGDAAKVVDGKPKTFWSVPASPGSWLLLDFRNTRPFHTITLDQGAREWDYPEELQVFVSDDPAQPGEVRLQATGSRYQTVLTLPAGVRGRYLLLKQMGTRTSPTANWSIDEAKVE